MAEPLRMSALPIRSRQRLWFKLGKIAGDESARFVSRCAIATALRKCKKRRMTIAKVIRKTTPHKANDDVRDVAYWSSRSVEERLAAVEALRQPVMDALPLAEQRLYRVYRVTTLKQG